MRRLPLIVFALVALVPNVATAGVVETCTFDEETATVTVVPAAGLALLEVVNGDEIWEGSTPCGAATTTNTDLIEIHPASEDRVEISLQGGAFAPGLTHEGDDSEVEFEFVTADEDDFFSLVIQGSIGDDDIRVGTIEEGSLAPEARQFEHEARIDLDAGTNDQDVDIVANQGFLVHLEVALGDGADRFSAAGFITGAEAPYLGGIDVRGGPGDDRIDPVGVNPIATDDVGFTGGGGKDTLQLTWLPDACDVILATDWAVGNGTIGGCDVAGEFPHGQFEHFVGHGGVDFILGTALGEEIEGRNGDDLIAPTGGSDRVDGGGGTDTLVLGQENGAPIRVRLDLGLVYGDGFGPGIDRFATIEEIISLGGSVDRFVGAPMPGLRMITGSTVSDDVLDLRGSTHPISVEAWNYPSSEEPTGRLIWAHRLVVLGSPYDDVFTGHRGDAQPNVFRGLEGDDTLLGMGAGDVLHGGAGNDTIDGGDGVDTCDGGTGLNSIKRCEH